MNKDFMKKLSQEFQEWQAFHGAAGKDPCELIMGFFEEIFDDSFGSAGISRDVLRDFEDLVESPPL